MTTQKTATIRLLNKTYDINCPEEEIDNLQLAAQKLNEQMLINKRKFKHLEDQKILLLAALNVSHELIICQKQQILQRQQVAQFISSLENRIQQVVHGSATLETES